MLLPAAGERLLPGRCRVTFHHPHTESVEWKPHVCSVQNQGSSSGNTPFLSARVVQGGGRDVQKAKPVCQHVLCCPGSGAGVGEEP